MGNEDECIFILIQVAFQPFDMFRIQIVGRLVQQQDIRLFQQQLAEKALGALAAAQLGNVTIQPDIGQPQGASHFLHFGVYHIKIMHGEHILYGSQLFHIHVQFFRGSLSHFLTDFIHMSFHFKKEGKGGSQCFTD